MNPADICTVLRLPTRVAAIRPAFSLQESPRQVLVVLYAEMKSIVLFIWDMKLLAVCFYMDTDDPFPVPNRPDSKVATPCQPIPRLRMDGGNGVALAYLDSPMKPPVAYACHKKQCTENMNQEKKDSIGLSENRPQQEQRMQPSSSRSIHQHQTKVLPIERDTGLLSCMNQACLSVKFRSYICRYAGNHRKAENLNMPWSSIDESRTISSTACLSLWWCPVVGTTNCEYVCVNPHNWHGNENCKAFEYMLSWFNQLW